MLAAAKPVRVQKYLADQGLCSRRAAEERIRQGEVSVNGRPAKLGDKVTPGQDRVALGGRPVRRRRIEQVVLAINKPRGYVCSNEDPHNAKTVFDLLPRELAGERLFCAGRLDKDSEGLVILSNDGELANRLMRPASGALKRYRVSLKQPFPKAKLPKLLRGVVIDGERLKVERAALAGDRSKEASKELELAMVHGKKREIRRLLSLLGFDVRRLKRYQIGRYSIKGVPLGGGVKLARAMIAKLFENDPEFP